jgi:uncharacterized protein YjbI with pentapeptide repeats
MADDPRPKIPISADWVLKRIQEGKDVHLRDAIIEGDLDLSKLDLPTESIDRTELQIQMGLKEDVKIVSSSINIANSTIRGILDFRNSTFSGDTFFDATFMEYAWFDGATFSEGASFNGATFSEIASFNGATFSESSGFDEATFCWASFNGAFFRGHTTLFTGATFSQNALFEGATFSGYIWFDGATFSQNVDFRKATFSQNARFDGATLSGYIWFGGATFRRDAGFGGTSFSEDADFGGAIFSNAWFDGATFSGNAWFNGATFSDNAWFLGAKFEGDVLTFRDATFILPLSQEEACRRAKNVLAKAGNRSEEEYHFFREMEAKRIRNGIRGNSGLGLGYVLAKTDTWSFWKALWYDGIEYVLVQGIFGYGVHPRRLIVSWFSVVIIFAIAYWTTESMKGGLLGISNYLESSFATAIAPGYIAVIINGMGHTPLYHAEAILETIMGTFLWAGFIATFAKRYMR